MELRHLRYFVAVAEARHFTRAARALGIGQPPLSQQIQALERELGTPLFARKPRAVALTPAGEALYEDARRILRDVERAAERVRRVARGESGRLRLGMINSAPFHPLIPQVIREFRRAHPQVSLSLDEGPTPQLAAAVRDGEPSGHPLAKRATVPLLALSIEPFVLFPRTVGAGLHDSIVSACRTAGFSPRIVQETSQVTSIVNLVAAGLGVSIVPASMQQVHSDGVTYRAIRRPAPKARLSLIFRDADRQTPQIARLLTLTRKLARA
jgi:DNA-binding transcriptional LysR family regulator